MFRNDLIDLLNSGSAWCFIGSGASVDAGAPTWSGLLNAVIGMMTAPERSKLDASAKALDDAIRREDFLNAFSLVEQAIGRDDLERYVRAEFAKYRTAGKITSLLASLPFRGYVTTNYDDLLERALANAGHLGWLSVGNSESELPKAASDASRLVWHVHGALSQGSSQSRLVLTAEDYDDHYLEDTPLTRQIRGLLAHHRIVVAGYGFRDPEVSRLLRQVGRLTSPDRPIFAFLGGMTGGENAAARASYLSKYNVEVIPYKMVGRSHDALHELLQAYSSFVVPRSQRFGAARASTPTHDPETTALLLYNDLCLKPGGVSDDAFNALLRARVLSLLKFNGDCSIGVFLEELDSRAQVLEGERPDPQRSSEKLNALIASLVSEGLIVLTGEGLGATVALTEAGRAAVQMRAAAAEVLSGKFRSSLAARAEKLTSLADSGRANVAAAAEAFLIECISKRALGVAMIALQGRDEFKTVHMAALLQALPQHFGTLASEDEALGLVSVVREFLTRPSDAEREYLGTALQARFGIHLLGYDPAALEARRSELKSTFFLVDSSTLIPLVAVGCAGHEFAKLLIDRLHKVGSFVATTTLLAEEVAEHARWALTKVDASGRPTLETLKVETGRAGARGNGFLDGFLEVAASGRSVLDLHAYLRNSCGFPVGKSYYDGDDLAALLDAKGIYCRWFDKWEVFVPLMYARRDELAQKIKELRLSRATYRHERQVQAEAEALILVQHIRSSGATLDGKTMRGGHFLSRTRVIDEVAGGGYAITMRPEAALQMLSTLTPCGPTELAGLTSSLLWELEDRGLSFVDSTKLLTVFSPLVDASKQQLEPERERYRALIAERFGEDPSHAFREPEPLDIPVMVDSFFAQKAERLQAELGRAQARASAAESAARLGEKDRREYERLKAKEKFAKAEALRRKRGAASKAGKKKKRKK